MKTQWNIEAHIAGMDIFGSMQPLKSGPKTARNSKKAKIRKSIKSIT
jgi:hypothetical protein